MKRKKIVCLGGGIGTVNLIRGLKAYPYDLTVVVSMADDGGSSGRLRRLYGVFPPGDVISCMAALSQDPTLLSLLTYRFAGDRYGKDTELGGHKLGNLLLTAFADRHGNFTQSIAQMMKFFHIPGTILPATEEQVTISAKTIQDRYIFGEEKIDLGKYQGKRILEKVFLHPEKAKAVPEALKAITDADVIIFGPGDLYTAQLPVLIVPEIRDAVLGSKAKKIYIVNVANKPFETRGYSVQQYLETIERHIGSFPFDIIVTNNNYSASIPKKYHYRYVKDRKNIEKTTYTTISGDVVDKSFPLYHDSKKLAKIVSSYI